MNPAFFGQSCALKIRKEMDMLMMVIRRNENRHDEEQERNNLCIKIWKVVIVILGFSMINAYT